MAGSFDLLFVQDFSSSSAIVVTHNLDLFQVGVRVIVGGQVRQDLVDSIAYTVGDPRNELTVNLSSAQTGTIQIVNNDVSWANFITPANAATISADGVGGAKYPPSATDPTSPAPVAGDRYYNTALSMSMIYDGGRSKWLSEETWVPAFSHNGRPNNNYLKVGALTLTSVRGYLVSRNATLCEIAYVRRNEARDPTIEVRLGGGSAIASLLSPNNTPTGSDLTVNADVAAGSVLQVYSANDRLSEPVVWLKLRWRV